MAPPPLLPRTLRLLIALTLMAAGGGLLAFWAFTHKANLFAPAALPPLLAGLLLDAIGIVLLLLTVARQPPR